MISKLYAVYVAACAVAIVLILACVVPGGAESESSDAPAAPEIGDADLVIESDEEMESFVLSTLEDPMDGCTVSLAADVSVSVTGGTFGGTFDGNGHTVTLDVTETDSSGCTYLFASVVGAVVYDVSFAGTVGSEDSLLASVVWWLESSTVYKVSLDVESVSSSGVAVSLAAFTLDSTLQYVSSSLPLVYVSGTTTYYGCGSEPYVTTRAEQFGDESDWNTVVS